MVIANVARGDIANVASVSCWIVHQEFAMRHLGVYQGHPYSRQGRASTVDREARDRLDTRWGVDQGGLQMLNRAVRALVIFGVVAAGSVATVFGSEPFSSSVAAPACNLGNGVQHVVEITFDNIHFFRDNRDVPSDLELMPHLRDFIEQQGVMMSNSHTPLIAHTAEDSLAIYTGLYGDRRGMPISNSYRTYNANGTSNSAGSFVYWTDPNNDGSHDANQAMIYSDSVPAADTKTNSTTPAPWVPWTRAGCDVGNVSTANMVLENAGFDIPKVFGAGSPETAQLNADPNSFKNAEVADYVGLGVHCAQGSPFCATAQAVKYGQSIPSPSAVGDSLPDEPGGYTGYQALFSHKYLAPQLGAGTPNLTRHGYQVTNLAGNLVDLNGNQLNGGFLTNYPGFPGFGPIVAGRHSRTPPTCSSPGCPWCTATSVTYTRGRQGRPGARPPPRPRRDGHSVRATTATSRRRRPTTRRLRPSSNAWPRRASLRTTRCSFSARRKTTSSTAPTSAEQ